MHFRKSLLNYLTYLEKAHLLNLLQQDVSRLRTNSVKSPNYTIPLKQYLKKSFSSFWRITEGNEVDFVWNCIISQFSISL